MISSESRQAERAREERAKQLAHKAVKRICSQGVMRGFGTWQEQWAEAARQRRMLAAAAARLARPALAAAVAHWRGEWEAALTLTLTQALTLTRTQTLTRTLALTLTLAPALALTSGVGGGNEGAREPGRVA